MGIQISDKYFMTQTGYEQWDDKTTAVREPQNISIQGTMIGMVLSWYGNWIPDGWAICDGSLLQISGNEALFNILGTTYGGDGVTTFALPAICGQMPAVIEAVAEVTNLTITDDCTVDGFITVTLNGNPYSIDVLNGDTADVVSAKIQVFIESLTDYTATVNSNTVTITAVNAGSEDDATLNGNDTGVIATVSVVTQGSDQVITSGNNKVVYKIIAI